MAVDRLVGHLESIDLRKRERIMAWTKGSPEGDFCFGTTRDPKQKGPSRLSRLLANACSRNRQDPATFRRAGLRLIEVQADEILPMLTISDRRSGCSINSAGGGGISDAGPDLGRQVSAEQGASRTRHRAGSADPSQPCDGYPRLSTSSALCTARSSGPRNQSLPVSGSAANVFNHTQYSGPKYHSTLRPDDAARR